MKNLIFTCLIILTSLFTKAQTNKPIDGFLGIKFGSTAKQVTSVLTGKGAIAETEEAKDVLRFNNLSLGSRKLDDFYAYFINDKVFQAEFFFKSEPEAKTIEYFELLAQDITGVYGKGEYSRIFKSPYKDGDGYEITALKSGNAEYYITWKDNNQNTIREEVNIIDDILYVKLSYQDKVLTRKAIAKQTENDKSEF